MFLIAYKYFSALMDLSNSFLDKTPLSYAIVERCIERYIERYIVRNTRTFMKKYVSKSKHAKHIFSTHTNHSTLDQKGTYKVTAIYDVNREYCDVKRRYYDVNRGYFPLLDHLTNCDF